MGISQFEELASVQVGALPDMVTFTPDGSMIVVANDLALGFANSEEFLAKYGPLTNEAFIDLLYANMLGRPGETEGPDLLARKDGQRRTQSGPCGSLDRRSANAEFIDRYPFAPAS